MPGADRLDFALTIACRHRRLHRGSV